MTAASKAGSGFWWSVLEMREVCAQATRQSCQGKAAVLHFAGMHRFFNRELLKQYSQ
jgi:hypothetical protein